MGIENFKKALGGLYRNRPFHPFTIELVNGARIEVNHPEALSWHEEGLVTVASTTSNRSVFEVASIVRFISATGTS